MVFSVYLKAQSVDFIEEFVEQMSAETKESLSGIEMPDQYLMETLVIKNLNKASKADLERIPWLTPQQIHNLLDYIHHLGPLVSVYELQAVPGWDLATIRVTESLVKVPESSDYYDPRNAIESIRQDGGVSFLFRIKRRFPLAKGFQPMQRSSFIGSPIYWLSRFRYRQKGKIDIGVTAEKDPGEIFKWEPVKGVYGADHLSAFIGLENKGPVKKLLFGDFRVQWDQGLVLGSGISFRKQVITGPRKVHLGIIPHSGTREYNYFRGLGLELNVGSLTISPIISYRKLDAQILEADSNVALPERVPSIIKTGLHRTVLETQRRMQLPEWLLGVHIRKIWYRNLTGSISTVVSNLGIPLIPTPARHNSSTFTGKRNINYSAGMEYQYHNFNFFSQVAFAYNKAWAAIAGLTAGLSHKISLTLLARSYQAHYHGISSNAYGMVSGNNNEQGIYWGLQYTPSVKWSIGASMDLYRLPFPTFSSDVTNHGYERLIRVQFIPNKTGYIDFYWRNRNKLVNEDPDNSKLTHNTTEANKHFFGLRGSWKNASNISVQSRIQYSAFQKSSTQSSGAIASNQVSYAGKSLKITLSLAHFSTDDYENRQYIFEKDLPRSLTIPFFYGVGTRWFCQIQLKLVPNLDFWLKIAQTNQRYRKQQGSGPDTTLGPKRTDLSLQIRYKL